MSEWLQDNMFGPPEPVGSYASTEGRGRHDDRPVPSERENLWPGDLVKFLGVELLEELYGDIPRRTRLHVKEICRRLRMDSNTVYNRINEGSLDGTPVGPDGNEGANRLVYRYSVVSWLFNREFRDGRTRGADFDDEMLEKIDRAVTHRLKRKKLQEMI